MNKKESIEIIANAILDSHGYEDAYGMAKCVFEALEWISVQDRLPTETGWYKIKTPYGELEAPLSTNMKGDLVWVLPGHTIITHWKNK